jgi:hypothetical protein
MDIPSSLRTLAWNISTLLRARPLMLYHWGFSRFGLLIDLFIYSYNAIYITTTGINHKTVVLKKRKQVIHNKLDEYMKNTKTCNKINLAKHINITT